MSMDAHAFWVVAPGRGEIRQETPPPPSASDVVVRTLYSGISRGTESLVFHGRVPPSEYQRMRAPFQQGDFPGPVKYGYANVGRVEQGPQALLGRTVFSLYPHQTRFVVPAEAVHVVPDGVPARRAVLAANMETALNGVWDARVVPGAAGRGRRRRHGRLPGRVARRARSRLRRRAGGHQPRRVPRWRARSASASPSRARRLAKPTSSSTPAAPARAWPRRSALAGLESTVVDLSWYGDQTVALPLGGAFHSRRLTIESSQVGQVARRSARALDHRAPPREGAGAAGRPRARRAADRRDHVREPADPPWRR